jgi:uncharacterized membrane protein (UPF0136 family)
MVSWLSYLVGALALLSIGGGVQGFVGSHSVGSLMGGVGAGLIMLFGLYVARTKPSVGYGITALMALALTGMMLPRYLKGHTIWPAGVMTAASLVVLGAHIVAHFTQKKTA